MRLLLRWIIIAAALTVAAYFVPGIEITGQNGLITVLVMAAVVALVNIFVKPLLTLLSCGLVAVTLGLFLFVINALCLWLASWVSVNWFGAGFVINGFWPALWGSVIVSIVTFVLSMFLPDEA